MQLKPIKWKKKAGKEDGEEKQIVTKVEVSDLNLKFCFFVCVSVACLVRARRAVICCFLRFCLLQKGSFETGLKVKRSPSDYVLSKGEFWMHTKTFFQLPS